MNWTQRQLQMIVTLADVGQLTQASAVLCMSQPTLTRALAELESQLGVRLFDRTTRRLQLSADGARLLPVARRLLADLQMATEHVRQSSKGFSGVISVAVGSAFGSTLLPPVLVRFARAHPDVQVRLIDLNSAGITDAVARAEVDLGIGSAVRDVGHIHAQELLTAPLGILCADCWLERAQRAASGESVALPWLKEPSDTSINHALSAHGSTLVRSMAGGHEVSSLALQMALVAQGFGVAVVSALSARHPSGSSLHFVPLSPRIERRVFVLTHATRALAPGARVLRDLLLAQAPELWRSGPS